MRRRCWLWRCRLCCCRLCCCRLGRWLCSIHRGGSPVAQGSTSPATQNAHCPDILAILSSPPRKLMDSTTRCVLQCSIKTSAGIQESIAALMGHQMAFNFLRSTPATFRSSWLRKHCYCTRFSQPSISADSHGPSLTDKTNKNVLLIVAS